MHPSSHPRKLPCTTFRQSKTPLSVMVFFWGRNGWCQELVQKSECYLPQFPWFQVAHERQCLAALVLAQLLSNQKSFQSQMNINGPVFLAVAGLRDPSHESDR